MFAFLVFFSKTEATHKPKQEQDVSRVLKFSDLNNKQFAPIDRKIQKETDLDNIKKNLDLLFSQETQDNDKMEENPSVDSFGTKSQYSWNIKTKNPHIIGPGFQEKFNYPPVERYIDAKTPNHIVDRFW